MKNLNKTNLKDAAASIQCLAGYQLNLPNKIKTAATCLCNDNDECKWVFKKGDVMCVKEPKFTILPFLPTFCKKIGKNRTLVIDFTILYLIFAYLFYQIFFFLTENGFLKKVEVQKGCN